MNKKFLFVFLLMFSSYSFSAEKKFRAPANLDCGQSKAITKLAGLLYDLNMQGTIKQMRYEKFMNAVPKASSCDEILELGIDTIADCTDKDLKKNNCKN